MLAYINVHQPFSKSKGGGSNPTLTTLMTSIPQIDKKVLAPKKPNVLEPRRRPPNPSNMTI